jgi:hypothetical protein
MLKRMVPGDGGQVAIERVIRETLRDGNLKIERDVRLIKLCRKVRRMQYRKARLSPCMLA